MFSLFKLTTMLNTILTILGIACLAVVFSELSGIVYRIKYILWGMNSYKKRLKPLDCPMCMAFWIALPYAWYYYHWHFAILFPFICAIAASFISKWIKP